MNATHDEPRMVVMEGGGQPDSEPADNPYAPPPGWLLPPVPRVRMELDTGTWQALAYAGRYGLDALGEPWRDRVQTALAEIDLRVETADALWTQKVSGDLHPAGRDL